MSMCSIKDWIAIRKDVQVALRHGYRRKIYKGTGKYAKYIAEVSFSIRDKTNISGFSYMSDICTQALLRRIAAERKER